MTVIVLEFIFKIMFLSQSFIGLDHGVGPCSIKVWVLSEIWQHFDHSDPPHLQSMLSQSPKKMVLFC